MQYPGLNHEEPLTTVWYGGAGAQTLDPATPPPLHPSTHGPLNPYGSTPVHPSIPPSTILSGRYRVEQLLGAGAFAAVHAAYDLSLHRWVALKLYDSHTAGQISTDEMRLQATCQHPNLMPLHDAGSDSQLGITYIVMPLYPGADLGAVLGRYGAMPFRTTLVCVEQVCSALEFLWQRRQIIHGDLKPANIWLTQSGAAILMDFNTHGLLARSACLRAGTPGFTAPEALQGRADARSDVFSLGCVLYTCLAGAAPFADDAAVSAGRYVPLRERRPDIRPEVEAVVSMALNHDPDFRFQDARGMRTALRSPARIMGLVHRGPQWLRPLGAAGRLGGTALSAIGRLGWQMVARTSTGAWRILESTAIGAGRLLAGFCRRLSRRPLQTAVEGVVLYVVIQWAYYSTVFWTRLHPLETVGAAVLLAMLAGGATTRHHPSRKWR